MEEGRLRRVAQYEKDRLEAVMSLDPEQWSVFCLRWALQEPNSPENAVLVMHKVRLVITGVPDDAKAVSREALGLKEGEDPEPIK